MAPRSVVIAALLAGGCSLSMIDPVPCADDEGCVGVFGAGSVCGPSGSCEVPDVTGPFDRTLSGTVSRVVPFAPDGDGFGTLLVAVFEACTPDETLPLSALILSDSDLALDSARIDYEFVELPRALLQLTVFLDDDENAFTQGGDNSPDAGDLVYGLDDGQGEIECIEVDLREGDLSANISLNLLEP